MSDVLLICFLVWIAGVGVVSFLPTFDTLSTRALFAAAVLWPMTFVVFLVLGVVDFFKEVGR